MKIHSLLCIYVGFLGGCEKDVGDSHARHGEAQKLGGAESSVRGTPSSAFGVTLAGSIHQFNIKCQTTD